MPGRRRDEQWDERIFELLRLGHSVKSIHAQINSSARAAGLSDNEVPSERTIARRQAWFNEQPEETRRLYDFFRWPDSVGAGVHISEVGVCLELWRELRSRFSGWWDPDVPPPPTAGRPSLRMVRAVLEITAAVDPGVHIAKRHAMAVVLLFGSAVEKEMLELALLDRDYVKFGGTAIWEASLDEVRESPGKIVARLDTVWGEIPGTLRDQLIREISLVAQVGARKDDP